MKWEEIEYITKTLPSKHSIDGDIWENLSHENSSFANSNGVLVVMILFFKDVERDMAETIFNA